MKCYYHITPKENLESIMAEGLKKSNIGIFLLKTNNLRVIQSVSFDQIFCLEVAVLKIDVKGIKNVFPDNVGEMFRQYQYYTKQEIISPEYIVGCKVYNFTDMDLIDFRLWTFRELNIPITAEQLKGMIIPADEIKKRIESED